MLRREHIPCAYYTVDEIFWFEVYDLRDTPDAWPKSRRIIGEFRPVQRAYGHWTDLFFLVNREVLDYDPRPSILQSGKNHTEDVILSSNPSLIRQIPTMLRGYDTEAAVHGPDHSLDSLVHRSRTIHDLPGGQPEVLLSRQTSGLIHALKSRDAIHADEDFPHVIDLASRGNGIAQSEKAVGPQHGQRIVPTDREGSSPQVQAEGKQQEHNTVQEQALRYIRRTGPVSLTYYDQAKGTSFEDASYADYDVSYEGEQWFHLLGDKCYSKFPPLIVHPPKK